MLTSPENDLSAHRVVSGDEWLAARKVLLAKEKESTRLRDELAQARRDLPWERVEKEYLFHGAHGPQTLAQIFGDARQLIVYHFMFDPQWNEGCKSCSFWADTFDGIPVHLKARDIAFAAISRAPYDRLEPYRRRMGWSFTWLSSFENDFNRDFGVTFSQPRSTPKGRIITIPFRATCSARLPALASSTSRATVPCSTHTPRMGAASTSSTPRIITSTSPRRGVTKATRRSRGCAVTTNTAPELRWPRCPVWPALRRYSRCGRP